MPRKRKRPGSRKIEKCLYIVCEGDEKKSEYSYFNYLIKSLPLTGNKVEIKLLHVRKNTGKELVREVLKLKQFPGDETWVVYDKNGYTKHPETFNLARQKDVNIAFSAISFEIWILLHFEKTSKPFIKSEDVIKYMNLKQYLNYDKSDQEIHQKIKDNTQIAINNATWLKKYQQDCHPIGTPVYDYDTYTNINELIEKIRELV